MSRLTFRRFCLLLKHRENIVRPLLDRTVPCLSGQGQLYRWKSDFQAKEVSKHEGYFVVEEKNKESYLKMIDIFLERDKRRTGHVEFIYSALKHMKEFGVEKDLDVYKKLIDIFPKGKMIPRNMYQAEFMHYPKQQQCAIDLLEQMEENAVMPDWEMQDQLLNVFGSRGYPLRRYWRMMYWFPKFRKASPWPLPMQMPNDTFELAKMAIERITSIDPTTEIEVYHTKEIEGSLEDTWIVSGQSSSQRDLIARIPDGQTLYVDGGQRVWLRSQAVSYFSLTTAPFRKFSDDYDPDDVSNLLQKRMIVRPSIHENDETVILGCASSGTSSPDSMLSWIRALSVNSPALSRLQVLFRLPQSSDAKPPPSQPAIDKPQDKIDSS